MADAATAPYMATEEAELNDAFKRYEHGVFVDNARRTALLAALFMLAGTSLDWMVFPELAWHFLLIRAVDTVLLCVIVGLLGHVSSERFRRLAAHALFLLPTVGMCWMIALTGGGGRRTTPVSISRCSPLRFCCAAHSRIRR